MFPSSMSMRISILSPGLFLSLSLISALVISPAASANEKQNLQVVEATVAGFLRTQSIGLPGEVDITLAGIDARTSVPPCAALEPSLPPGSRPWGNTAVVVRCTVPQPWTLYVRAQVKVVSNYVVSTRPLMQGRPIAASDLAVHRGDLTQLPAGVITDVNQAIGRTLTASLPFGGPLREDMLRAQPAVMLNQSVKLVSSGRGFSISAEGRALGNAVEGQPVQVRNGSGQVVSGIARAGAIVEISY